MANPSRPKARQLRESEEQGIAPAMPQSIQAEKGLLGSFLLSPSKIEEAGALPMSIFYHPSHQVVYDALLELIALRRPIDMITLTQHLHDQGKLAEAGGGAGVSELYTFVATAANWSYYLDILKEKHIRRGIIETCERLEQAARQEEDQKAEVLLDQAENELLQLTVTAESQNAIQPIKVAVRSAVDEMEANIRTKGRVSGLSTGFSDIDRMTGGFKPGEYVLVGARPSNGKTALALNWMLAFQRQTPVMFFSLEMGATSIARRLICSAGKLNVQKTRNGFWSDREVKTLMTTSRDVEQMPIYINDTAGVNLFDFRSQARRAVSKYGCGAIVIDYLQYLKSTSKRAAESRTQEVAEISRTLKSTFKELGVVGVVLCQLDRDAENRPPKLSDLRESGQIEQDGDHIGFIHRPNKPKGGEDPDDDEDEIKGPEIAQYIIGKQRDGPIGPVNIQFEPEYVLFSSTTEKLYSNNPSKRQKH